MGVHKENIRPLIGEVSDNTYNKNISITTAYYKSVNNKTDEIQLAMCDEEINICMLTETWIKDQTKSDKLEQMGHKLLPVNKLDRPGGGNRSTFQQLLRHDGTR